MTGYSFFVFVFNDHKSFSDKSNEQTGSKTYIKLLLAIKKVIVRYLDVFSCSVYEINVKEIYIFLLIQMFLTNDRL